MGCSLCDDFERALQDRTNECHRACVSETYGRISTRFVAYSNVEMERARSELQMHRSVCASVAGKGRGRPSRLEDLNRAGVRTP
jgi:hypothetical protein